MTLWHCGNMEVWQCDGVAVCGSMAVCGTLRHRLNLNPRDWRRPPAANTEFDMSNVGVLFFKDSALITCVWPWRLFDTMDLLGTFKTIV